MKKQISSISIQAFYQKIKAIFITLALSALLSETSLADPAAPPDGHFSDWAAVPEVIRSITDEPHQPVLDQLHQLTQLKLGSSQVADLEPDEQKQYMIQSKQRWLTWWETTGKPVADAKKKHAKVDAEAFDLAWTFLNSKKAKPEEVMPVWIPSSWTLQVAFTNGDYGGREKELWIITRTASEAHLRKLRGSYDKGGMGFDGWTVKLEEFKEFTTATADHTLKAICYINGYAPTSDEGVIENEMKGIYYPHAELRLMDGEGQWLWNTEAYNFTKSQSEYGTNTAGRTYYFLRSTFNEQAKWAELAKPTAKQLEPFRDWLAISKPYFSPLADDIIQLFGKCGTSSEIEAMFDWAEKQMVAVNPDMDWRIRSDEFGANLKVNVMNFTRAEIKNTLQETKKAVVRMTEKPTELTTNDQAAEYQKKLEKLERFIVQMDSLDAKEQEDEILSYPQPLQSLIRTDRQQRDPDLKHLTAAIQKIRDNPDPKLFRQLAAELDEGTVRMRSLMGYILVNEHDSLKLKAWEPKQEAIAVEACIDALAHINEDCQEDLIIILLNMCDGGTIEIKQDDGGRKIQVPPNSNGGYTLSQSDNPLPVARVQDQLRELYKKSKKKR